MGRTDAIGSIGDDAARLSAIDLAREVIQNRRTEMTREKEVAVGRDAPNVTASAAYSPVIYAQAASLQLYTQAGTVASSMNNQSATNARLFNGRPPPIRPVDSATNGSNLNALV